MEFLEILEGRGLSDISNLIGGGVTTFKDNLRTVITDLPFDLTDAGNVFIPVVLVVLSIVVIYDLFVVSASTSTSRAVPLTPLLLKTVNFAWGMKDQYDLVDIVTSRSRESGWGPMLTVLDLALAKYGHHY
ncbi:unnamed protein product [Meganyctiphanes norvegica]|uniref:Uncharacterized protein n=1 Tax=Meganyctiphanes norvegica TaxID=48144 RepID=A0AAV2RT89_MEGNR